MRRDESSKKPVRLNKFLQNSDKKYMTLRLTLLGVLPFLLLSKSAQPAQPQGTIIQVLTKLRMNSAEPPSAKDYFIDVGRRLGVKEGDIFEVLRPYSVMDHTTGEVTELLTIPLAEVKVFLVGEHSSIARVVAYRDPQTLPVLEYTSILLGDEARLKSSLPSTEPSS